MVQKWKLRVKAIDKRKESWTGASSCFFIIFSWNGLRKRKPRHQPFGIFSGQLSLSHYRKLSHTGVLGSQQVKLNSSNERLDIKNDVISELNLHFTDEKSKTWIEVGGSESFCNFGFWYIDLSGA